MSGDRIDRGQAAALLEWWRQAGADVAVRGDAPSWLELADAPVAATPPSPSRMAMPVAKPASEPAASAAPKPADEGPIPETLEAFKAWLAKRSQARGARHAAAVGPIGASLMIMGDRPDRDDIAEGLPFGGDNGRLAVAMAGAMGVAEDALRQALLEPGHLPGERLSDHKRLAEIARAHIRLARPKRLVLFGDAPARALIDKPLASARAHLHEVEGVPTVATFHPRWLLQRPQDKRLAWQDLLLLMEKA